MATDLRDELLYADSIEARFQILEKYILMKSTFSISSNRAVQSALVSLQKVDQRESIATIVDRVNLSAKHFVHPDDGD
ncbi:hypothetical protein [Paenibacillus alkalitolerans]|uniref:hypothetical protein n=1 Tax=Paenibacillus alkalitolerans TaxID=2799335 RepID=UPI0018F41413|nr:hypothetical protein [Paenibacillus alkalitolerans]